MGNTRWKRSVYIYGLKDPRDDLIYYVGKSIDPDKRLVQHVKDGKANVAKREWMDSVFLSGHSPEVVILETTNEKEWQEREIYWIARGREEKWPLTNIANGGGPNAWTEPDYSFVKSYICDDLQSKFDVLSILEKDQIVLSVAQLMASYSSLVRKAQGKSNDPRLIRAMGYWAADTLVDHINDDSHYYEKLRSEIQESGSKAFSLISAYTEKKHGLSLHDG